MQFQNLIVEEKLVVAGLEVGGNEGQQLSIAPFLGSARWFDLARDGATGAVASGVDTLFAMPFCARGGVLAGLGFQVVVLAAGGVARVGLYSTISNDNLYPGDLVVDAGQQSTAANGVKLTTGLASPLLAGKVYWAVYLTGTLAATVMVSESGIWRYVGYPAADFNVGAQNSLTVAFAYAALPVRFPVGAVVSGSAGCSIYGNYST